MEAIRNKPPDSAGENRGTAPTSTARVASMAEIREHIVAPFMQPPPSVETLRDWFNAARIPRFKSNPTAKRGGGPVFYSVPAVEKYLRSRLLPGKVGAR